MPTASLDPRKRARLFPLISSESKEGTEQQTLHFVEFLSISQVQNRIRRRRITQLKGGLRRL